MNKRRKITSDRIKLIKHESKGNNIIVTKGDKDNSTLLIGKEEYKLWVKQI